MERRKNSTGLWLFAIASIWILLVLFWYVWFHPEHLRPYYHFLYLFNHLFVFLFIICVSAGAGRVILVRLVRWEADSLLEEVLFSFAVGFALLSYSIM
ncbi:MAG: hypothetical protein N2246_05740, partial [Candidatus Sumerlaeia bacterium]|nr:hypothetical protein [Candidatus Sumerlaeia bacterium]